MFKRLYILLRRIYWKFFAGRCWKCGVDTIDWSGYISTCFVCPLCEMHLHKSEVYKEMFSDYVEKCLQQYKKIWGKDYES